MTKQKYGFEWQVGEEEWQTNQSPMMAEGGRLPQPVRALRWSPRWYMAAVILLACVLGAGAWLWYSAESGLASIQEELRTAVQVEMWAVAQGQLQMAAGLADEAAGRRWRHYFEQEMAQLAMLMKMDGPEIEPEIEELQLLALQQEVALVHVITSNQKGEPLFRQTRFYRRAVEGWQRTAPDEELWGPPARLESSYFVFEYRQRDAAMVAAVAPQLDRLYGTMAGNFGWPSMPQQEKLSIKVMVSQPPGPASIGKDHSLQVASPLLYLAPNQVTDDQLLAQSIALPLLDFILREVNVLPVWQPMLDGLRLWQLWELDLPLSAWQDEVAAWVYVDAALGKAGHVPVLPVWYLPLCVMHSLWLESPIELQIPLPCDSANHSEWDIILRALQAPLTHLAALGVPAVWPVRQPDLQKVMPNSTHAGQAVALAVLIEYAEETYGRAQIPLLIAELGRHDTWESLLPAVFGVSRHEFERGWQTHLASGLVKQ